MYDIYRNVFTYVKLIEYIDLFCIILKKIFTVIKFSEKLSINESLAYVPGNVFMLCIKVK